MRLKKWVVTYRTGNGAKVEQVVYVATRSAAIEAVTCHPAICARNDILSVYEVPG